MAWYMRHCHTRRNISGNELAESAIMSDFRGGGGGGGGRGEEYLSMRKYTVPIKPVCCGSVFQQGYWHFNVNTVFPMWA
jgi:hypothetical protein